MQAKLILGDKRGLIHYLLYQDNYEDNADAHSLLLGLQVQLKMDWLVS